MEGKFTGKIVDYGIQETKNKNLLAVIQFEFMGNDEKLHRNTWRGSFNGGALEITLKTLILCGLVGNDPAIIADGISSGALNTKKEYLLTLKNEIGSDGKTYTKISWVNDIGVQNSNLISRANATIKLGDLRAHLASLRKDLNQEKSQEVLEKLGDLPF